MYNIIQCTVCDIQEIYLTIFRESCVLDKPCDTAIWGEMLKINQLSVIYIMINYTTAGLS